MFIVQGRVDDGLIYIFPEIHHLDQGIFFCVNCKKDMSPKITKHNIHHPVSPKPFLSFSSRKRCISNQTKPRNNFLPLHFAAEKNGAKSVNTSGHVKSTVFVHRSWHLFAQELRTGHLRALLRAMQQRPHEGQRRQVGGMGGDFPGWCTRFLEKNHTTLGV